MDNGEKFLEDNIERLIQVGLDLPPRVDPDMKEKTWRQLMSQLDINQRHSGFPDSALVILTCSLAWMAIGIIRRILTVSLEGIVIPSLEPFHVVLALNLLCLPVTGIVVIVARRRYVE
ncbi:hypothetical protein ACFL5Z_18780 [Planctomycetota bacterium]